MWHTNEHSPAWRTPAYNCSGQGIIMQRPSGVPAQLVKTINSRYKSEDYSMRVLSHLATVVLRMGLGRRRILIPPQSRHSCQLESPLLNSINNNLSVLYQTVRAIRIHCVNNVGTLEGSGSLYIHPLAFDVKGCILFFSCRIDKSS